MNSIRKFNLYVEELTVALPLEFTESEEINLPKGMMQTYPDYKFSDGNGTYITVSRRQTRLEGAQACMQEIIPALRYGEEEMRLEGAWKREIHDIEIGKLYYSTKNQGNMWFHMVATFEFMEQQYLIMAYVKMIYQEIWEALFDKIIDSLEVRDGQTGTIV